MDGNTVQPIVITIQDLFATFLKKDRDQIDAQANYFELGGDSLSTVTLAEEISRIYQVEFSLIEIFENPTPEGLAEILGSRYLEAP